MSMQLNYPGLRCLVKPFAYIEIDGAKYYLTYSILQWIIDQAVFCGNMIVLFEILRHFNIKNAKGRDLNYTYFYRWKCNKILNFHNRQFGHLKSPEKLITYNHFFTDFVRDQGFFFYAYARENCPKSLVGCQFFDWAIKELENSSC